MLSASALKGSGLDPFRIGAKGAPRLGIGKDVDTFAPSGEDLSH